MAGDMPGGAIAALAAAGMREGLGVHSKAAALLLAAGVSVLAEIADDEAAALACAAAILTRSAEDVRRAHAN